MSSWCKLFIGAPLMQLEVKPHAGKALDGSIYSDRSDLHLCRDDNSLEEDTYKEFLSGPLLDILLNVWRGSNR